MSAFNIVHSRMVCPSCRARVDVAVQFKYGDTWQHEYVVGDRLRWGGNQIGTPGAKRVVVAAVAERCPACGYDGDWDLYVFVEQDRITGVESATDTFDFVKAGKTYIELER